MLDTERDDILLDVIKYKNREQHTKSGTITTHVHNEEISYPSNLTSHSMEKYAFKQMWNTCLQNNLDECISTSSLSNFMSISSTTHIQK